jgi:hypothetical protein
MSDTSSVVGSVSAPPLSTSLGDRRSDLERSAAAERRPEHPRHLEDLREGAVALRIARRLGPVFDHDIRLARVGSERLGQHAGIQHRTEALFENDLREREDVERP